MLIQAKTIEDYFAQLPDERKEPMRKLRETIVENLPEGFEEDATSGMINYAVPHHLYPAGYHCDPKQPLPFLAIASQKNFIALYHMGLYADKNLLDWFLAEYPKHLSTKLDMGKSCIRFKKPEQIPYKLIGQLVKKMSPALWISVYENVLKK